MSNKDEDDKDWFWKFLLLSGPPWEVKRNPLYIRGINYVAGVMLAIAVAVFLVVEAVKLISGK